MKKQRPTERWDTYVAVLVEDDALLEVAVTVGGGAGPDEHVHLSGRSTKFKKK
jgi:hypothetical protein